MSDRAKGMNISFDTSLIGIGVIIWAMGSCILNDSKSDLINAERLDRYPAYDATTGKMETEEPEDEEPAP